MNIEDKEYVLVIQCHIVKESCSGYYCEKYFHERGGGFVDFRKGTPVRVLYTTCGGCCGRGVHRRVNNLLKNIKKAEKISKNKIVVKLSSCITKENYHGPACPHLEYLQDVIGKLGVDVSLDTVINETSEKLRKKGVYKS